MAINTTVTGEVFIEVQLKSKGLNQCQSQKEMPPEVGLAHPEVLWDEGGAQHLHLLGCSSRAHCRTGIRLGIGELIRELGNGNLSQLREGADKTSLSQHIRLAALQPCSVTHPKLGHACHKYRWNHFIFMHPFRRKGCCSIKCKNCLRKQKFFFKFY